MRLTAEGRAFRSHAQRALQELSEGRELLRELREGRVGELLVGTAPAISTYVLPLVLRRFQAAFPNVHLIVRTGHSEEILELVLREQVHVGLVRELPHVSISSRPLYEDEIVLVAVTHGEAARLRLELGQPAPATPDERIALGMRGLLLAAATGPQISVAVSAVAGVYALLHNAVDVESDGEGLLSQLDSVGTIALAAAALLAAAYVLSFLAAIVVFAGFEVQRDAQVLRIRSGLLARRAISIPLARVDGVVIVEGLARGPLGLAALRLESAAHGGERAAGRTLLPLVRRSEAEAVIARLVPELAVTAGELERPPRRALRRFVLIPALAGGLVGAGAALALPATAVWAAVPALALIGALVGLRGHRACGVRLAGDVVVVREARVARRTLLARRRRLQEHSVSHTPLQARAALADLRVTVGSGGQGRARHLERATADAVFGALLRGDAAYPVSG